MTTVSAATPAPPHDGHRAEHGQHRQQQRDDAGQRGHQRCDAQHERLLPREQEVVGLDAGGNQQAQAGEGGERPAAAVANEIAAGNELLVGARPERTQPARFSDEGRMRVYWPPAATVATL